MTLILFETARLHYEYERRASRALLSSNLLSLSHFFVKIGGNGNLNVFRPRFFELFVTIFSSIISFAHFPERANFLRLGFWSAACSPRTSRLA